MHPWHKLCPENFGYDSEDYDPRFNYMWINKAQQQDLLTTYIYGIVMVPDGRLVLTKQVGRYQGKDNRWTVSVCRRKGYNQSKEHALRFAMYMMFNLAEQTYPDLEKKHLMSHTISAASIIKTTKVLEVFVIKWPSLRKLICSNSMDIAFLDLDTITALVRQKKLNLSTESSDVINMVDRYFNTIWGD